MKKCNHGKRPGYGVIPLVKHFFSSTVAPNPHLVGALSFPAYFVQEQLASTDNFPELNCIGLWNMYKLSMQQITFD